MPNCSSLLVTAFMNSLPEFRSESAIFLRLSVSANWISLAIDEMIADNIRKIHPATIRYVIKTDKLLNDSLSFLLFKTIPKLL